MPDASPAAVGARVRARREELGMTRRALADLVHRHINTINQIERGTSSPSFDLAIMLTHALRTSLNQLAYGETTSVRQQSQERH